MAVGGIDAPAEDDIPEQVSPSPVYPGRQVQVTIPALFLQLASALQPPLFAAQPSVSVKL